MDNIETIEISLPARPLGADANDIGWRVRLSTPGMQPPSRNLKPQEASRRLRELANHIDGATVPVPADTNIQLVPMFAAHLVPPHELPASIAAMSAADK